MLSIQQLSVRYGPIPALKEVTLAIDEGEIVTVLGANGAGKTTLLRTISGLLRAHSGQIQFGGRNISHLEPHDIVGLGITHVPEGRGILGRMTVLENLKLGAFRRSDGHVKRDLDDVLARFPILAERQHQAAAALSGGQQQMLAIARAVMAKPKLMLLDEPSLGLAPLIVAEVLQMIGSLRGQTAVLLVEQNTRAALRLADRAYVLELGRIALQGPSAQLINDAQLVRAYLGQRATSADLVEAP
jgi:branched-chain amino acid transport system ATP-binding protein